MTERDSLKANRESAVHSSSDAHGAGNSQREGEGERAGGEGGREGGERTTEQSAGEEGGGGRRPVLVDF